MKSFSIVILAAAALWVGSSIADRQEHMMNDTDMSNHMSEQSPMNTEDMDKHFEDMQTYMKKNFQGKNADQHISMMQHMHRIMHNTDVDSNKSDMMGMNKENFTNMPNMMSMMGQHSNMVERMDKMESMMQDILKQHDTMEE